MVCMMESPFVPFDVSILTPWSRFVKPLIG